MRIAVADTALSDTMEFLKEDGDVGILDATNTTRSRRQQIFDIVKLNGFKCLFLESVCDNPKLIEVNSINIAALFTEKLALKNHKSVKGP